MAGIAHQPTDGAEQADKHYAGRRPSAWRWKRLSLLSIISRYRKIKNSRIKVVGVSRDDDGIERMVCALQPQAVPSRFPSANDMDALAKPRPYLSSHHTCIFRPFISASPSQSSPSSSTSPYRLQQFQPLAVSPARPSDQRSATYVDARSFITTKHSLSRQSRPNEIAA